MTYQESGRPSKGKLLVVALIGLAALGVWACSGPADKARVAVEQYLKGENLQDLKLDLFCTRPGLPDKAYVSVTVTHNFGNADGKPQKEFLGYILQQDGPGWKVERSASYTKEEQKARDLLTGAK